MSTDVQCDADKIVISFNKEHVYLTLKNTPTDAKFMFNSIKQSRT